MEKFFDKEQTKIIKGIAILFVIISHIGAQFTRVFTPLGGIGTALFLAVSGYGLEKSYQKKELKKFWYNKIMYVLLPYASIEICMYLFGKVKGNINAFILDILLILPVHTWAWYLNFLFMWYLIFWITHKIFKGDSRKVLVIFVLASFLCSLLFFYFSPLRFEQSFSFLFGILLAYYNDRILCFKATKVDGIKLIGVCCIVGTCLTLLCKQSDFIREGSQVVLRLVDLIIKTSSMVGVILLFIVIEIRANILWVSMKKILNFFGKNSYALYIIHCYSIEMFELFNNKFISMICFLVVTIVGLAIWGCVRKALKYYIKSTEI